MLRHGVPNELVLHCCSAANLTISSPLEAHKSHNIVFSIVGLDCGFDNAIFAAIELDYSDADQVRTRPGSGDSGSGCSLIWPPPCGRYSVVASMRGCNDVPAPCGRESFACAVA